MAKATDSPEPAAEHPSLFAEEEHQQDVTGPAPELHPHYNHIPQPHPYPAHQAYQNHGYTEPSAHQPPPAEPAFQFMHDASFRNLFLGFFCIFVALMLFGGAWVLLGPQSLIPFVTAILVLFLLTSLWAFGIHRQRGGLFLSLGLVSIVGALIPLLIGVVLNLPAGQTYLAQMRSMPGLNNGQQPQNGYPGGNSMVQAQPAAQNTPLLSEVFGIYPPANGQSEQIRVLSDSRVELDGRIYLMRAGQIFPVHSRSEDGVVIRAKDYLVTLSRDLVEVVSQAPVGVSTTASAPAPAPTPSAADLAEKAAIQARSTEEAKRRYPALAIRDSDENRLFVDMYNEYKANQPAYLEDPNWPLKLAKQLAELHGWQDITQPQTRKPVLDPNQLVPGEDDSSLFNSDTQYLNAPVDTPKMDSPVPGMSPEEAPVEDLMVTPPPGEVPAPAPSRDVDLDAAPPLEISPDR